MLATYALVPDERVIVLKTEELSEVNLPPQAILLETEASVVSPGTELAIFTAAVPGVRQPGQWNSYPFRPGYGAVGRVLAAGAAVEQVAVGSRVFCYGQHASHQIYPFSERRAAFVIDEDLSAVAAAMIRMAVIALTAIRVAEIQVGITVAVFGLGVVGNLAAQFYRLAGARVIGFDPVESRCELARSVGMHEAYSVAPAEQVALLKDLTGGIGAHVTVDAVGHSAIIETCVDACVDMGQVVLLGSPRTAFEGDLTRAYRQIHLRWLTMRGALELPLPPYPVIGVRHSIQSEVNLIVDLVRRGQLHLEPLVSHVVQPASLETAYLGLLNEKDTYHGVVIDWTSVNR